MCFGWADSLPRRLSDSQAMLYVAPRKPTSAWSAREQGTRRAPDRRGSRAAGRVAVVDAAKASGIWSALDDVERLVEPDNLRAALDATPEDGRPGMASRAPPRERF